MAFVPVPVHLLCVMCIIKWITKSHNRAHAHLVWAIIVLKAYIWAAQTNHSNTSGKEPVVRYVRVLITSLACRSAYHCAHNFATWAQSRVDVVVWWWHRRCASLWCNKVTEWVADSLCPNWPHMVMSAMLSQTNVQYYFARFNTYTKGEAILAEKLIITDMHTYFVCYTIYLYNTIKFDLCCPAHCQMYLPTFYQVY